MQRATCSTAHSSPDMEHQDLAGRGQRPKDLGPGRVLAPGLEMPLNLKARGPSQAQLRH